MEEVRAEIIADEGRTVVARTDGGEELRVLVAACAEPLLVGARVVLRIARGRIGRATIDEAHRAEYQILLSRRDATLVARLGAESVVENGSLRRLQIDRLDGSTLAELDRLRGHATLASARLGSDPRAKLDARSWRFASRCPALRDLELVGRLDDLLAVPPLRLARLVIRSAYLSRRALAKITAVAWPALEELVLWIGASDVGLGDLAPILDGKTAPGLRALGICNTTRTNDVCRRLARSPLASRLQVLDLSLGTMTDGGAAALGAAANSFPHLRAFDASQNLLTPLGERYARTLVAEARTMDQRPGYGEGRRVPAVVEESA